MEYKIPPPESMVCIHCKKTIEPVGCINIFEGYITYWCPGKCNCEQALKLAEQRKQEITEANRAERKRVLQEIEEAKFKRGIINSIGSRFKRKTFDNFIESPGNTLAFQTCKNYVENFSNYQEQDKQGLYITGDYGTGKTHLASAIANKLTEMRKGVIIGTSISLLDKFKETWSKSGNSEWEVLKVYNTIDLLIIDDLGKEKNSEWAISRLYSIINERYEQAKPLIITSNYDSKALLKRLTIGEDDSTPRAILSRLYGMCLGVKITGKDWRME